MGQRHLLVIGSKCEELGPLTFLPDLADRFYKLMTGAFHGNCVGVPVGNPPGCMHDPTVDEAKKAIETALKTADQDGDVLILVYIGHALTRFGEFFLMPKNAKNPPMTEHAVHLVQVIKQRPGQWLGGLVLILDTCSSGEAVSEAAESWVRSLEGRLRFELLSATNSGITAEGWFTRTLVELLERGDPTAQDWLGCQDARRRVLERHPQLYPQFLAYNTGASLELAHNLARVPGDVFWRDSQSRDQILKQTEYYEPTPQLSDLVEASRAHQIVVVTGEAGVGKSTLAAALARPEITNNLVPRGFTHAIILLNDTINPRRVAVDLERQLRHAVPGFPEAIDEFQRSISIDERKALDFLRQRVLRPLAYLPRKPPVRIVLDGFNQLPRSTRQAVGRALDEVSKLGLDHVHLVITARDDTPDCPRGQQFPCGRPDPAVQIRYLMTCRVPAGIHQAVLERAKGNWLITRLLRDAVLGDPKIDMSRLHSTTDDSYAKLLDQAGAAESWKDRFEPVLGPLAVAGYGPVLPIALLVHASEALGGPRTDDSVREVLVALQGLVMRRMPGTVDEHDGLFHPTLAEYLLGPSASSAGFELDAKMAHRAVAEAIDALAPGSKHDPNDPRHCYAFLREADHWWAIGDVDRTLKCLRERKSNVFRENLDRWRQWHSTIQERFGENHLHTLLAAGLIAFWTGESGDARMALRLSRELLERRLSVQGPNHADTLGTRRHIARWTGKAGHAQESLRLFRKLLPDQVRVLGPDHTYTLTVRHDVAHWAGEAGDPEQALRLCLELLPDRQLFRGPDHPQTLGTRHSIAHWAGEAGDARRALRLFQELLPDREKVQGPGHPETLVTRQHAARWTGEAGDAREALRLLQELLPVEESVLGRDHPTTLESRHDIAHWTGEAGDAREALRLFQELLPDRERVLGRRHPDTLKTRNHIAHWTGESGDQAEALRLLRSLLEDRRRPQGSDHPDTLNTRQDIAHWTGEAGNPPEALRLSIELLSDRGRAQGSDHPDVLNTRHDIAHWTGEAGNPRGALRLMRSLLSDRQRVQGVNHPHALVTRHDIAQWTEKAGNPSLALQLFNDVLTDQEGVLGRDHPETLNTLAWLGVLKTETGDPEGGRLLHDGLSRAATRFGMDHPTTRQFQDAIRKYGLGEPAPPAESRQGLADHPTDRDMSQVDPAVVGFGPVIHQDAVEPG